MYIPNYYYYLKKKDKTSKTIFQIAFFEATIGYIKAKFCIKEGAVIIFVNITWFVPKAGVGDPIIRI